MTSIKTIFVPTDFSPGSLEAVQFARSLAKDLGAEVVIAHVIEPSASYYVQEEESLYLPHSVEVRRLAQRRLEALAQEGGAVRTRTLVCEGAAWEEILRAAKKHDAQLIVIGSRGAGRFVSAILGSTVSKVLHHATCPVLIHQATRTVERTARRATAARAPHRRTKTSPTRRASRV